MRAHAVAGPASVKLPAAHRQRIRPVAPSSAYIWKPVGDGSIEDAKTTPFAEVTGARSPKT